MGVEIPHDLCAVHRGHMLLFPSAGGEDYFESAALWKASQLKPRSALQPTEPSAPMPFWPQERNRVLVRE